MLSVSRLYRVDDRMINEYEAAGGIKIGRTTEVLGDILHHYYFVHQKSNMTRTKIELTS
jgi:hypothetical protein